MSTGLFANEEDGYNLEEEQKYKLKLDAPKSEPAFGASDDEGLDDFEDAEGGFGDEEGGFGDEEGGDKPFDDEPFDAGVEADEDEDPEKYIQQLAGKLGTSLRKYNDERGEPDFDLEKYAINSVISASHTAEMEEEDQKDIIKKVKMSGAGDENDDIDKNLDMDEPTEDGFDEDPNPEAEGDGSEGGFGDEGLEEGLYEEQGCWKGYKRDYSKEKYSDDSCEKINESEILEEAEGEYDGRTVTLNKPTKGDTKKFKVYVKNDKGNVVKVEFGDPDMEIRRDNDEARKNFRARHNCADKKDKTTAGYWSCKMWSNKKVSDITENLQSSEKISIFAENEDMKTIIKGKLDETTKPAPVKPAPTTTPERKSPKRKIWETRPVKKPAKMESTKLEENMDIKPQSIWWENDPNELLAHVYWLRGKLPPSENRKNAFIEIANQLNQRHPAPEGVMDMLVNQVN